MNKSSKYNWSRITFACFLLSLLIAVSLSAQATDRICTFRPNRHGETDTMLSFSINYRLASQREVPVFLEAVPVDAHGHSLHVMTRRKRIEQGMGKASFRLKYAGNKPQVKSTAIRVTMYCQNEEIQVLTREDFLYAKTWKKTQTEPVSPSDQVGNL